MEYYVLLCFESVQALVYLNKIRLGFGWGNNAVIFFRLKLFFVS